MKWLKVILIVLMVLCVSVNATGAIKNNNEKPIIYRSNGKLRYHESKLIVLKMYPILNKLDDLVISFENIIIEKNRKDKDFYPMLYVLHEMKISLVLLDHCVSLSIYIIHLKSRYQTLFFNAGYNKIDKMMSLVDLSKITMRVNFNYIDDESFIKKSKEGLKLMDKIQILEDSFFERLID